MRLLLKVRRHKLPEVQLVWAATERENGQNKTISSLIHDVNASLPLESVTWALDDYIVEVGGFECLHYNSISDILKDGDEVTIRALSTPDIKQRRLGGRTQITADGFHLLDGVPFGLGPTQRPPRPGILIPSRKRRLAEFEERDDETEDNQLTVADIEEDESELAELNSGKNSSGGLKGASSGNDGRPNKKQKSSNVTFKLVDHIPGFDVEEDSDEDENDSDFGDSSSASESRSDDSEGQSDQDEDSEESSTTSDDISASSSFEDQDEENESTQASSASDAENISGAKRNANRNPESDLKNIKLSETDSTLDKGLPVHEAKSHGTTGRLTKTQIRNQRRRDGNRLGHLKRLGHLPQDATIKAYYQWRLDHPQGLAKVDERAATCDQEEPTSIQNDQQNIVEDVSLVENLEVDVVPIGDDSDGVDDEAPDVETTDEVRRRPTDSAFLATSNNICSLLESATAREEAGLDQAESKKSQRARLDVNGSRRVIFGALGQRTPKTAADAERVKARLAVFGIAKEKPVPKHVEPSDLEKDPYSQSWRSKITLTAVECTDPSQKLSEPPYPFVQRWDPSQQTNRGRGSWGRQGKARKKKQRRSYGYNDSNWEDVDAEYGEEYDYNEADEDYNGEEEYEEDSYNFAGEDSYETAVSFGYDGANDNSIHAERQHLIEAVRPPSDLPELPEDLSCLATLQRKALVPGAIIAFQHLECDERTGWQPIMSPYRTAKVLHVDDKNEAELELAIRDCRLVRKRYDSSGKRMFEKFETIVDEDEDEEEDDGIISVRFADMVDAKLVGAAAGDTSLEGP